MNDDSKLARFETTVLVHLDGAYSLARWIVGDEPLARDCVQDACLNALHGFETRTGPSARAWFMAVVRNACLDALRTRRRRGSDDSFDEELHSGSVVESAETSASRASDARWLHAEIARLPVEFREVLVLRELEGLTYKEISAVVKVPIGTVMSRLSRARDQLGERLRSLEKREPR